MLKSMAKLSSIVGDVKIKLLNFVKENLAFPGCQARKRGWKLKTTDQCPREGAME